MGTQGKEPPQWDGSFGHPKHMLKLTENKIFTIYTQKCCLSKSVVDAAVAGLQIRLRIGKIFS